MIRFSHAAWLGLAALTLIACGAPPPPRAAAAGAQAEPLGQIVERYWDENAALLPWYTWGGADLQLGALPAHNIAPQSLADSLAIERRFLAQVLAVPRATLNAETTLTFDVFRRERALAIEGFTYPLELLPVNPYDGMPLEFAQMAATAERLALSSAKDYENWRRFGLSFVRWTDQAVVNMRDGMRRGYTLPRVLVEKTLPQLAALGRVRLVVAPRHQRRQRKPKAEFVLQRLGPCGERLRVRRGFGRHHGRDLALAGGIEVHARKHRL